MTQTNRPRGLWAHPDFLKLWGGETVALFGLQITNLALPLAAALALGATPFEMGLLGALQSAPALIFGLVAGAWADRLRRRPIMLAANLARAATLATVPLAALLGRLQIAQLYLVAFVTGCAGIAFMVAYQPYLGTLVAPAERVEGNSKLRFSEALAQIAGPGLGGAIVQLLSAPLTLALGALAPLASFAALAAIRAPEPPPAPRADRRSLRAEIGEGVRAVFAQPVLRAVIGWDALGSVCEAMILALVVLHATRDLGLAPGALGGILAVGGPFALAGTVVAGRLTRALGFGPTLIAAGGLMAAGAVLVPLADGPPLAAAALLGGWRALGGLGSAIYTINFYTLLQGLPPRHLQGRVNATARVFIWGAMALGALLGGALGQWLGIRPALIVAALGLLLAPLGLARSPIRALQTPPTAPEPAPAA